MMIFEPDAFRPTSVFGCELPGGGFTRYPLQGPFSFFFSGEKVQLALTETDHGSRPSRVAEAGLETEIGHHILADSMPFEMAPVQYSFHGLSPEDDPKRSCPISSTRKGVTLFRRSWYGVIHRKQDGGAT
jgi:hypothetical protein